VTDSNCRRQKKRGAWTRVELAVVVLVLLLVAGFIVVVLQRGRDQAHRVECAMHLKHLGDAMHTFDDKRKTLPASCIAPGYATWAVQIAPYLRQDFGKGLSAWDQALPYYQQSEDVRKSQVWVCYCPGRRDPPQYSSSGDVPQQDAARGNVIGALGDYGCAPVSTAKIPWTSPDADGALIVGEVVEKQGDRIVKWQARTSLKSLKRGTSYTILLGEKHVPEGGFGQGALGDSSIYNGDHPASFARLIDADHPLATGPEDAYRVNFGSWHSGICQFLMADTSVRPLTTDTSVDTLQKMIPRQLPE
jgi:hypothetical protein